MVTAEKVNMNHSWQRGLPALLSASIAGILLTLPTLAQAEGDGVPLHGFADVGYTAHSKESTDPKGFNVGSLDFYLTPQFDSNVKGLIEIIFETTKGGEVATDLERMQIGYTFSDNATLWAGRFHTPYGYWNTGFHHGAQIQTAVLRPRFLDFEDKGGILPAHMVGFLGSGKVRAGIGKFTYDVFAGNGPKISMGQDPVNPAAAATPVPQSLGTLNINTAGDNNHQAMAGLNLGYEFSGRADGLRLSIHALRGDVDDDSDGTLFGTTLLNKTEVSMAGGSVVYQGNEWEVLGEYYRFNNKDKSGTSGSHSSWADYLQLGRTFKGRMTPFLRVEKTVLSQLDNYFSMQDNGQSYFRQVLGFKYDVNPKASLKFELMSSKFAAETGRTAYKYRSLLAQYAIRF
ncbi:MAG: hypothetical protein ABI479_07030 [Gallionella sp.]